MPGQELRRRLREADPNLIIVPRKFYSKRKMTEVDWEKSKGVICSKCGREVFRSRGGLCMSCWEKENEIEVRDTTGITSWLGMDIIKQITHQAKKEPQAE